MPKGLPQEATTSTLPDVVSLPDLFPSLQYGFSQVVTTAPGRMIFLSGQVAWDAEQNLIGSDDLKAQTLQALRNIERGLSAAGASMDDLVAMRLYILNYFSEMAPVITEALNATFEGKQPPACTWIGVETLAHEGLMIEIEATAVVAEGN